MKGKSAKDVELELNGLKNPQKAKILSGFFKTGKGEYGEGDVFLGLTVPKLRLIAGKYKDLVLTDIQKLLSSSIHEYRLAGLMVLRFQYEKGDTEKKKEIFYFYLKNTKNINNWDLVDLSCQYIIGNYLLDKERNTLYKLAKSDYLWERRIAIISTFEFIRNNQFDDTLEIAQILLKDKHDLIHKAVGWMLREVGKRDLPAEEEFLKKHYKEMPGTMLRYAVEKFEKQKKKYFLKK